MRMDRVARPRGRGGGVAEGVSHFVTRKLGYVALTSATWKRTTRLRIEHRWPRCGRRRAGRCAVPGRCCTDHHSVGFVTVARARASARGLGAEKRRERRARYHHYEAIGLAAGKWLSREESAPLGSACVRYSCARADDGYCFEYYSEDAADHRSRYRNGSPKIERSVTS